MAVAASSPSTTCARSRHDRHGRDGRQRLDADGDRFRHRVLLENAPAPGFGDSYPIAWAETGRSLLDLVDAVVVPGHGDPFDRPFAERQVDELAELAELARQSVGGAIGLDEAIRRSPFPARPTGEALERARLELSE